MTLHICYQYGLIGAREVSARILQKAPNVLKDVDIGLQKIFQAEDVADSGFKFWYMVEKLVDKYPGEDGLHYYLWHLC